jgi:hypothetical protein
MNSEFITAQADRFAARLEANYGEAPESWVDAGWQLALGRKPSGEEKDRALAFLAKNPLSRLCLLLFNMNEFLYVD